MRLVTGTYVGIPRHVGRKRPCDIDTWKCGTRHNRASVQHYKCTSFDSKLLHVTNVKKTGVGKIRIGLSLYPRSILPGFRFWLVLSVDRGADELKLTIVD